MSVDDRRFDAIARDLGSQSSRRVALQGLVGGLLGVGLAQRAAAQGEVGTEGGCHPERCTKKVLGRLPGKFLWPPASALPCISACACAMALASRRA